MQGLNDTQIPRSNRPRSVVAMLLIVIVLYTALFASGVVSVLIIPQYEDNIRTVDDLLRSELPVAMTLLQLDVSRNQTFTVDKPSFLLVIFVY